MLSVMDSTSSLDSEAHLLPLKALHVLLVGLVYRVHLCQILLSLKMKKSSTFIRSAVYLRETG